MNTKLKVYLGFMFFLQLYCVDSANAFNVKTYKELTKTSVVYVEFYVRGIGEAYGWSSIQLGDKAYYCPPKKLSLNAQNYMSIIDREIEVLENDSSSKNPSEIPIPLVLFSGLNKSFPCSKQK